MTLVATVDIVPDEAHEDLSAWVDVCSHSNISRMSSRYLWSGVAVLREYPNKCFASSIRTRFFWYEFDNVFLLRPPQDIAAAYGSLGRDFIDKPRNFLRLRTIQGTYPQRFVDDVMPLKDGLLHLANRQLQIMDEHFPEAPADLQQAFEEFGQGILWDDRPDRVERGIPIHMMDGAAATMVGYHRWNGIIRAVILLGADEERWLAVNRFVVLACAIQTKLSPVQNSPNNPPIEVDLLDTLRNRWLVMSADQLDGEFARIPINT